LFDAKSPDGDDEVYVADLVRGTAMRLSDDPRDDFDAVWSHDGRRVIWTALPSARSPFLVMRSVDGAGPAEEVFPEPGMAQFSGSVSQSGILAYTRATGSVADIWTVPLSGDRKGRPFMATAAREFGPEFSPNGKWIAYVAMESGARDVYVAPYPGPGAKRRVTNGGAASPVWSRDGRELYYQTYEGGLMAVSVTDGPDLVVGAPRRLFSGDYMIDARDDGPRAYDVSPDGKRFLMFVDERPAPLAPPSFQVLLNWAAALTSKH